MSTQSSKKNGIEQFLSAIVLVGSNSVPLLGVLFYGWNVFTIVLAYWMENVVIGVFTVLKMMKAQGSFPAQLARQIKFNDVPLSDLSKNNSTVVAEKMFLIPFFSMHFGIFTLVHGIFVLVMFFSPEVSFLGVILSFLSLCISHFVSYQSNYISRLEYQTTSPTQLFLAPYPRIIVMHLTVIIGGFFAMSHQSIYALAVLVVLKTIADVLSHFFEHRKTFFTSTV